MSAGFQKAAAGPVVTCSLLPSWVSLVSLIVCPACFAPASISPVHPGAEMPPSATEWELSVCPWARPGVAVRRTKEAVARNPQRRRIGVLSGTVSSHAKIVEGSSLPAQAALGGHRRFLLAWQPHLLQTGVGPLHNLWCGADSMSLTRRVFLE